MQCEDKVSKLNLRKHFYWPRLLFSVRILIDPGCTHLFITADVCDQLQLAKQPMKSKNRCASGEEFLEVLGVGSALVSMNNFYYTVSFSAVSY